MPDQEQERLQRLRDRQLADRNPNAKQQKFSQMSAQRERKRDKSYSLSRAWGDIPHIWKGAFYGLLAGLLIMLVLPYFWLSSLTFLVSILATIVTIIFGTIVGNAIDTREEIKKLMR